MDQWQSIGTHRARIEEDTIFLQFIGDVTLEHTRALSLLQEQILAKHGRLFSVTNLHEVGNFSADGRRFLGEWNKKFSVAGVAQYGGTLMGRVMSVLMIGAIRALGGHVPEMKNVSNEDEGRAWINELRRKLGPVVKK